MQKNFKLHFLSFLIIFFVSFSGCTKKEEKVKTFGGSFIDIVSSLQKTSDGNLILAGLTYSFGAGLSDAFIVKLDKEGNMIWQKTFGGIRSDTANSIQQTSDGGYILAGSTFSSGKGLSDAWILKLDKEGNLIWQKTYGGTDGDTANSIQQTSDGGYILAGSTFSSGKGLSDAWILKVDKEGDLIWQKTYGDAYRDEAYSISQTSDGGYIVAGHNATSLNDINLWVFKIDHTGKMLWQKKLGNENIDEAYSVIQTSDGGYIVVGYATPSRASFSDIWVLKLSKTGGTEWEKIFGGARRDVAASVVESNDGGYIIAGSTTSYGEGNYDIWVLKLDQQGNILW